MRMSTDPLKVLLVEDNPGDARLIQEMLRDASGNAFALEHVAKLSEGLGRLSEARLDVVLLDLLLPESEGMDTFRRVHEHAPAVPVVVLTGSDDEVLAAQAVQGGAQDYLVKGQVDSNLLARSLRYAIERGRIEEQLRQRAQELAEADRRKDEFLAMLAHELRNPLSALTSAAEYMRMRGLDAPDLRSARDVIERQTRQLTRLVDDLLDVSRITRGVIQLQKRRLRLSEVIAMAIETVRPLIDARRHELVIRLPSEPIWLEADPLRLQQIVANLLTNSAKYTEPGGTIWLNAAREAGWLVLRIRDTGIGIEPAMLPRVFDFFTQADRSLARSQGGLGIGLTLVRRLVELHTGTVEAFSEGLGRGSEFVLRLPILPDPAQEPAELSRLGEP